MKFLETARLVVSLLPVIIQAIRAVEDAIHGQGAGEMKLAAVRALLESAYDIAQDGIASFADLWPAIERTIAALVAAFNSTGWGRG